MKLVLAFLLAFGVSAQEAPKRKATAKRQPTAHAKATPEQIRKFKQLEEKQKK